MYVRVANSPQVKLLAAKIVQQSTRSSSGSTSTLPENLRKAYELYQRDDGVPVFLKAGFRDRILYVFTAGSVVFGSLTSYYTLITMAFPKKK